MNRPASRTAEQPGVTEFPAYRIGYLILSIGIGRRHRGCSPRKIAEINISVRSVFGLDAIQESGRPILSAADEGSLNLRIDPDLLKNTPSSAFEATLECVLVGPHKLPDRLLARHVQFAHDAT